jgi:hypothetical protein
MSRNAKFLVLLGTGAVALLGYARRRRARARD